MTTPTRTQIPGYVIGTWDIDPVHSDVSFTVRHMMVSKVRGHFGTFSGEIVTGPQVTDSAVTVSIDASSIDTNNDQRDAHIRSADFFAVDEHPTWTYRSTGVRVHGPDLIVDGELTIKGHTRPIEARGTSFRDYRDASGGRGAFVEKLAVYGRGGLPCPRCGARLVETHAVDGRTTVFCARCQE